MRISATRHEVLLFKNPPMMQLMPRNDVGEPPHGDFILVGNSAAHPCCFIQIAQQRQGSAAYRDEVLNQILQWTFCERAMTHVVVLLKTFEGRGVGARDAHGAVG